MADNSLDDGSVEFSGTLDGLQSKSRGRETAANGFSRAFGSAFSRGVADGRRFDDVLKSLTLRISDLSVRLALQPVTKGIAGGLDQLFSGLTGSGATEAGNSLAAAMGAIKPFAAGGVIGTPTYFPMQGGGVGLAGEAGPEAIMPLTRGPDGRLGVASAGGGTAQVTINIATPDAASFRRSEAYLTGQIARAVSRGQRSL